MPKSIKLFAYEQNIAKIVLAKVFQNMDKQEDGNYILNYENMLLTVSEMEMIALNNVVNLLSNKER